VQFIAAGEAASLMLIGKQTHVQCAAILTVFLALVQLGRDVKKDIIGRLLGVIGFALVYGSLEKIKKKKDDDAIELDDDSDDGGFKEPA
jgi:hypothetical protein